MTVQLVSFRNSFAPEPKRYPTQAEIFAEENRVKAEKAKEKPKTTKSKK